MKKSRKEGSEIVGARGRVPLRRTEERAASNQERETYRLQIFDLRRGIHENQGGDSV